MRYLRQVTTRSASHPIELPKYVLHAKVLERKKGPYENPLIQWKGVRNLRPTASHAAQSEGIREDEQSLVNQHGRYRDSFHYGPGKAPDGRSYVSG